MRFLGINATFHDPAAALVVDGRVVAAAEEERFSRRKHGKRPVPFSAWELPEQSMRWVLAEAGINAGEVDGVGYSFDPAIAAQIPDDPYDHVRLDYVRRAPWFIAEVLPGLDRATVSFVQHHVAHAASSGLAGPYRSAAVLVSDGRGEAHSHLAGHYTDGELGILARQSLPDSLGLLYESLTEHLGFVRSSDEYKVMALASYGTPRFADELRECVHATGDGGFTAQAPQWQRFAPRRIDDGTWGGEHADLAASVQLVVEETLVDLARWLREQTGETVLTMAGGTALNCVANSRIWRQAGFDDVWVQPASGDSGTALGAALVLAQQAGELAEPEPTAALGRSWGPDELAGRLRAAQVPFTTPGSTELLAGEVADVLAANGVVAWFDGRSEFGPRALGHRSLLANPTLAENLERLNDVKGREQFRPVAPMVLEDRAAEIFSGGPIPSPYMLFVHEVAESWRHRIPAVTHVDGTARIQTVNDRQSPGITALLRAVDERIGAPVVVNTSLNTAGRPMVDDPRDALELFGSAPVAALVLGPHLVRRSEFFAAGTA